MFNYLFSKFNSFLRIFLFRHTFVALSMLKLGKNHQKVDLLKLQRILDEVYANNMLLAQRLNSSFQVEMIYLESWKNFGRVLLQWFAPGAEIQLKFLIRNPKNLSLNRE